MAKKKPIVALIYDFDGTLSPGNMQEFGFIQAIGKDKAEFWAKNKKLSEDNDANGILTYMYLMIQAAKNNGVSLRRESFKRFGENVELFDGVKEWFALVNEYGKSIGLDVKHYINSSGLKEMIEGTPIAKEFENIYACSFLYDVDGIAYWPAVAIDYTTKTQFLFKINKGIKEVSDNKKINQYIPEKERPIPFERMIYFGDGDTDIPCMKMIKEHGGHSIAVYANGNSVKKATALQLIKDNRVNFVCPADYRAGKEINMVVKRILDKIKADYEFQRLLDLHHKKIKK
ncbi:haloacid dehalogenase-like hydrolase [Bacteroides stercoris]|uniref:Haloacid dehalogenase-like hydrolase n=1 Tax=Bacteroides stercoris TaxID=46506 RepID=A0A412DX73_BACSE|nr:HAD family hydrolase [Bacteroides stercoris]RGR24942.1 haloacid dehalogenase-like hydrolase [Bacteroides stercoris]RGR31533.1 haloacid dehalogenase-like hydrolase [Bacteroides stercoris]